MTSRWPFPGDSPTDRARQVALQYRAALERVDPAACLAIDQAAGWAGEGWVVPGYAVEVEEDLISAARAAELVGRSRRWVYLRVTRASEHPVRVRLVDVRAALAHERGRRALHAR